MKFYVALAVEVVKLQFKFYDNRTSLSMRKSFFPVFGSVKKINFGPLWVPKIFKIVIFFSDNDQ